jgi:hypothetical protein
MNQAVRRVGTLANHGRRTWSEIAACTIRVACCTMIQEELRHSYQKPLVAMIRSPDSGREGKKKCPGPITVTVSIEGAAT